MTWQVTWQVTWQGTWQGAWQGAWQGDMAGGMAGDMAGVCPGTALEQGLPFIFPGIVQERPTYKDIDRCRQTELGQGLATVGLLPCV